ncbi:MAG: HEAT repeat domain-containing protein [Leptolyngbyaceae cyanobacterium SM1_1_3]|nr:HEAT repeat domain-containing protein [Leptolyngbyaceae cyanobacterium SM1_1_3]NJN01386.1 HEAT repeat domain-containing protein [Leptolyngbyaceae cyanobacterium RM1_1_2]NJO11146.1 HEAT repeat domain-containing protein [Leptolyngbyaceae cyanobacterium SL_1_1]
MDQDPQVSTLIQAVEQANSPLAMLTAVRSLAAVRHPDAIPTLIEVLGFNNPGAAVTAVEGLAALGSDAVLPLLKQLDDHNYGARAWAIRALADIGDPRALAVLLDAATADFALSVRRAAARGLGNLTWTQLPEAEIPEAQVHAVTALLQATHDSEWIVRYAAVAGLQMLAQKLSPAQGDRRKVIQQRLEQLLADDPVASIQARSQLALSKLG